MINSKFKEHKSGNFRLVWHNFDNTLTTAWQPDLLRQPLSNWLTTAWQHPCKVITLGEEGDMALVWVARASHTDTHQRQVRICVAVGAEMVMCLGGKPEPMAQVVLKVANAPNRNANGYVRPWRSVAQFHRNEVVS